MANKNKKSSNSPGDPENRDEHSVEEPVVRDKRRIDPETGEVRHPESAGTASTEDAAPDAATADDTFTEEDLAFLTDLAAEAEADAKIAAPESSLAAERLADLQRLQAEYVNYRKRVQRDRETARENAIAEVVKSLLPILDDLDRAHAHGDLEGTPLDLVAQKLRSSFERYGLTAVGAKGDVFDHNLHEAIYQQPSPDVTVNTVADVIESGYLLGEKLLRPAKVAVDVPAE
jgi:molecular chaperone GrpE